MDTNEEKMIIFRIRLAMDPPEVHTGRLGEELPSTSITKAWTGTQANFDELWRKSAQEKDTNNDVSMVGIGEKEKNNGNVDEKITNQKSLTFAGESSIFKSSLRRFTPQ